MKDIIKEILTTLWRDNEQRRILLFLGLTVCFMALEFIYGYLSNSIGLISDSFHMMVDSCALLIGLAASYISKRGGCETSFNRPLGLMKIESLSALIMSLFLVSVSYNLLLISIDRLKNPQSINIEKYDTQLVFVSIGGLLVNLLGLKVLGEEQSSDNMKGLFLHVLADTLGSLGVLVSCFLIKYFGILISDPLCAILVSITILVSVIPLLKSSFLTLLG